MQRLRYARFLLPFAGTGLASLGPAEGVEELRDELRIGKLQSAGAERIVGRRRVAAEEPTATFVNAVGTFVR